MLYIRIATAIGKVIYKIPGVGKAAERMAAELVKNGGKIIKLKKGQTPPNATTATAANVAKAVKNLKKSNTGAGRPSPKKGSNVKKKNETATQNIEQFSPGGSAARPMKPAAPKKSPEQFGPGGGGARPGVSRTGPKKPTKPKVETSPKKPTKPKSPFAKKTAKEKAAAAAKLKRQLDAMKKPNRATKTGRFDKKGAKITNVPKTGGAKKGGLKSRIDAKAKRAAMGLGVAAVKVDNLSQSELDIGPRTPLPKKAKNPSAARKKPMQNPRSLKPKKPPVNKPADNSGKGGPASKPPVKKEMTFGEKFNAERKLGNPTFPYKGKKYTTRLKEESIKDHKKKFGVTGKY